MRPMPIFGENLWFKEIRLVLSTSIREKEMLESLKKEVRILIHRTT